MCPHNNSFKVIYITIQLSFIFEFFPPSGIEGGGFTALEGNYSAWPATYFYHIFPTIATEQLISKDYTGKVQLGMEWIL